MVSSVGLGDGSRWGVPRSILLSGRWAERARTRIRSTVNIIRLSAVYRSHTADRLRSREPPPPHASSSPASPSPSALCPSSSHRLLVHPRAMAHLGTLQGRSLIFTLGPLGPRHRLRAQHLARPEEADPRAPLGQLDHGRGLWVAEGERDQYRQAAGE